MADPWPTIHEEREVLAKDLSSLTDEQWATPSLCAGWTVRDVLGHMTATAKMTPPKFFRALAGAGFKFNEMTAREIARETVGTPADTLAEFRRYPEVSGPLLSLIMAMTGRQVVLGDLSGDGVGQLRERG